VAHHSKPRSELVACPICRRTLKWTADRWLDAFECEQCGQFTDFGGSALPSEQRHRSPQLSLPYESTAAKSQDSDDKDHEPDGTAG